MGASLLSLTSLHLNYISGPNGFCYTISHSRLKNGENDHHWKLFENLPATHAFVLDRVQIYDEQTCKAHLTNLDPQNANLYPDIFKVLCTTIVDEWAEELKAIALDEKLQVRWINYTTYCSDSGRPNFLKKFAFSVL